jgi:cytochrome c
MRSALLVSAAAICAACIWAADANPPAPGRDVFQKRCTGCHSLDSAKVGPALRGVFGRRAASDSSFRYSDALKKSSVVWDAQTLDRWLADPEALVPDNEMAFRLENAAERAAIIEYLKQLPAKRSQP